MSNDVERSPRPWWWWVLPGVLGLVGLALMVPTRPADWLARHSYDWLHQLVGLNEKALKKSPVIMVYLDRDSYRELGLSESLPWPRKLHAQLLERLSNAGARAVVMDIIFSGPGENNSDDQTLADAIRNNGTVVIGEGVNSSTSTVSDVERPRVFRLEPPFPLFATNAAAMGLTSIAMDEDFVSRRHFSGLPSIDRRSLSYAAGDVLGATNSSAAATERWMRYYGPPLSIDHVSYHRALNGDDVPDEFFRDRVVVIGAKPVPGQFNERSDEWRSPFVALAEPDRFMPGAEVHATQLMNLLCGDWLRRPSAATEGILWCVFGLLAGTLMIFLRPVWGIPAVAALGLVVGIVGVETMSEANVWFAWLVPVMVQAPIAIVGGLTLHSADWYVARREAMRRIREQAELIDKAQDAILLFDLDGALKSANPRARELFDIGNGGGRLNEFFSESAPVAKQVVLESGQWQGGMKHRRQDGGERNLASRWTLIHDEQMQPTGILIINTDVTEQKIVEAQLISAQRMEGIGAIAGGMAHDLNNSLAPLLLGVQLLRKRHEDAPTRQTLEQMEVGVRRGVEMVRQVLFVARGKGGETGEIDPGLLIKEMATLARETFPGNIRVEFQIARDLWPVNGNPTQIHQVLLNLCVNARDAMPDGGTLTIAADNVEEINNELRDPSGPPRGEGVSIMVNDTGIGIPAEKQPRVFEAFFTTKPEGKGTGLGLPTVKRIVESHSGCIQFSSTPDDGTTFEIFLPRSREISVPEQTPTNHKLIRGGGQSVLVIGDTASVRELLNEALTHHGYRVLATDTPSEALEQVAAGRWVPHAIVLGLNHPGIDGLELLAAFRRHLAGLPAILLGEESSRSTVDDLEHATFLTTPLNLPDLLHRLSQLINETSERQKEK